MGRRTLSCFTLSCCPGCSRRTGLTLDTSPPLPARVAGGKAQLLGPSSVAYVTPSRVSLCASNLHPLTTAPQSSANPHIPSFPRSDRHLISSPTLSPAHTPTTTHRHTHVQPQTQHTPHTYTHSHTHIRSQPHHPDIQLSRPWYQWQGEASLSGSLGCCNTSPLLTAPSVPH